MRTAHIIASALATIGGLFVALPSAGATYGDTSTFAGKVYDGDGGAASSALLDFADDVADDASGNLYIADTFDNAIRKVGTDDIITTLAGGSYGFTDGMGAASEFAQPRGVAVDADGNVYVADTGNDAIRKITSAGIVTTLVNTGLADPYGVGVAGSTLFIADSGNNALKSVPTSGGSVSTITTGLSDPRKLAVTSDGSAVYVADNGSHRVLKVVVSTGAVSVVAGSGDNAYLEGTGAGAKFENVWGVALDTDETRLFVSDHDLYLTDRIRTIDLASGATTLFTSDTTQTNMIFPAGMAVHGGNLYVAMSGLGIVRRYATNNASATSVKAGGDRFGMREGSDPLFGRPHDIALSADRQTMYVADNNRIRKLAMATKTSASIIGSIVDNYREGVPVGAGQTNLDEARFSAVSSIVVTNDEKTLYVADRWNNRLRKIDLSASPYRSLLVTGAGRTNSTGETSNGYQEGSSCDHIVDRNDDLTLRSGCAYFLQPTTIVLDPTEAFLYVADTGNNRIRKVAIADGATSLVAGSDSGFADGTGSSARFNAPWGLALSDDGRTLYVADRGNHRIRAVDLATNTVTTIAGAGSPGYQEGIGAKAFFSFPRSLKLGADGFLYITEAGSHRVRQLDPATGLTKLVTGSGNRGYVNGAQETVEFNNLEGLAPATTESTVYVVDSWNDVIRAMDITGTAPYADPAPTVTKVAPHEVDRDWDKGTGLRVKILGTGFRHGAVTKFYTYTASKTYVVSATEAVAIIPLKRMKPGWYDVTVTNTDGQFGVGEALLALRGDDDSVPDEFFSVSELRGLYGFDKKLRGGFQVGSGNVIGDSKDETIAGTGDGQSPIVRVIAKDGSVVSEFKPYAAKTNAGVRIATCDLNGDGTDEIVTAPGVGSAITIRIFNARGTPVILPNGIRPFSKKFKGGATIVCGDVSGDGRPEIIVAPGKGGSANVLLYVNTGAKTGSLAPYGKKFKGGFELGLADLDGNGTKELLIAPESGARPVLLMSGNGKKLTGGFSPFGKKFKGGMTVAGGDTNADGKEEIIVAPRSASKPLVKVYGSNGTKLLSQFYAYPRTFRGGVKVSSGDVNGDGIADIITVPASKYPPSIRFFKQNGATL